METIPLIEFKNVSKQFDDKIVLNKVNLTVYEDQITTIIGKSGTGKSVLLKHIVGLLKPDGGAILFEGKPVAAMKKSEWQAYKSRVAYLFQNNALLDSMTVFDNVAFPLQHTTNLSKAEIKKRVLKRIEDLELTEAVDKYPSELSGGMQKRVALARALVTDPKIVLFDEPTTGQDPIRKNMILSMISRYRKKFGFTAIMISHDVPDVFFYSGAGRPVSVLQRRRGRRAVRRAAADCRVRSLLLGELAERRSRLADLHSLPRRADHRPR